MNQAPTVSNVMPSPSGESEESFIGKFMSSSAMQKEYPDEKQRAAVAYKQWREGAKNSNAVDFQAIESADVTIPIIRADVLSYGPGELGSSTTIGKEGAKVLYSAEALRDPEFLETVMRAPFSVSTHEKNTNEANRDVDGWAREVWFDENDQTVYAKGYVVGADNVQYVKDNKLRPGFGTSAFIKFLELKKQDGVSSTGKQFSAIATKLSCSHTAILPSIRDEKNVIVAVNALQNDEDKSMAQAVNDNDNSVSKGENAGGIKMAEESKIDEKALKNAVEEIKAKDAKNAEFEEMKNSIKTLNEKMEELKNSKNAKNEDEPKKEEPKAENTDEDGDGKEDAKNALASESLIASASEILGIRYEKAPTLGALAKDFGVTGKNKLEIATALNAKIASLKPSATNATKEEASTYADFKAAL